ncbi:NAD(P)-binding Rossmann-fold superfamily protein [Zea mays]|uniref:NAD(P)-binding Rossmann-fold superfamily protein n=3 Tax=Zea mays TaxID=4577 RepID=A0A1D6DZP0_MAIZE|nr:NAD(P)-binding Rossmann-fold superfamily protein [Zea mays]ONM13978.1 NAD(P)-binding Rossmann-fold superfamily protein [Zea mays]ONM13984.1 NAD(P)-binding Rossmann-fold superfamily protein [Zea mays]
MGRGKVELKKIENPTNRQVTFSKRRMGLFKKANELAILCDAQIGVIIFSGSGRMYEYSSPPWRIASVFDRYLKAPSTRFEEMDIQQKIVQEMTRMKDERNRLRMIMAQYMAEDLASFSAQDLSNLEQQIEFSLYKVRLRKQELLDQQLLEIHQREMHMPAEQGGYLCLMNPAAAIASGQHQQAGEMVGINPRPFPWWDVGASGSGSGSQSQQQLLHGRDAAESSMTALGLSPQLHGYRLQPRQPNLQQDADIHGWLW